MVDDEVEDDAHAAIVDRLDERLGICEGSERFVDILVVGDIVTIVDQRALVVWRVLEGLGVDLIDYALLPPLVLMPEGSHDDGWR